MDKQILKENNSIKPRIKWFMVIVCVLFILNAFWLNILYRRDLFTLGLSFIKNYQDHGNRFTTVVYNIFSLIAGVEITFVILALTWILPIRKATSLVIVFYVTAMTYMMSIWKQAYIDPRPTWITDDIKQLQWKCQYTYGFPSGHCWIILILHEAIITDLIGTRGIRNLFYLEPFIFVAVVPFSRLYLGDHSDDQVVSSLVYGFAFAMLFKLRIQHHIFKLFGYLIKHQQKWKPFVFIILLQLLIAVPPIVVYNINVKHNRLGDHYLQRLNQICGTDYTDKQIEDRQASQSGIGNIIPGMLYGLLLYTGKYFHFSNGDKKFEVLNYFVGNWNFGEGRCKIVRNFVLKMLLYIFFGGIFVGIFFALIPYLVHTFYGDYFSMAIAWTFVGIFFVKIIPELAHKCNLIHEVPGRNIQNSKNYNPAGVNFPGNIESGHNIRN